MVGELRSITGPIGFVTTFNQHDPAGRAKKITDPKGIVTDVNYSPRGRVTSVASTVPDQAVRTTNYT